MVVVVGVAGGAPLWVDLRQCSHSAQTIPPFGHTLPQELLACYALIEKLGRGVVYYVSGGWEA